MGSALFTLRAGDHGESEIGVTRIAGREGLSEPFWFDVDFVPASGTALALDGLVGASGRLTLHAVTGEKREIHGRIESADLATLYGGARSHRIRLVPRLALLRYSRRRRIFQDKTVPQIVGAVLDEAGVDHRSSLAGAHGQRAYTVQHHESDLDFVSRLLEAEGIFYRFDHSDGKDVVVLCDGIGGCQPIPGNAGIPCRDIAQASDEEYVSKVSLAHALEPDVVVLRDFDFEHPGLELEARAAREKGELEFHEYPGGFRDAGEGRRLSQVRLEEIQARSGLVDLEGTVIRIAPGLTFHLSGDSRAGVEGDLLTLRIEHEGIQGARAETPMLVERAYSSRVVAIDSRKPYRPPRRTPRAIATGLQTATVVGPASEEIHVDDLGRIRVQFHWDRDGRRNEHSSCWVRTVQGWAGRGYGGSFVPRVGQEVVVRFIGGDPDVPLVEGAVYNGRNYVPAALPEDRTQSTMRTSSSPGGSGQNELRIEDGAGREWVQVHAQRDAQVGTGHDKRQRVGGSERLRVEGDRSIEVTGSQHLDVTGSDSASIGGKEVSLVAGSRKASIASGDQLRVGVARSTNVAATRSIEVVLAATETVGAAAALNVGGAYLVTVGGALNTMVGAARFEEVGGLKAVGVGAHMEERVGGDATRGVGGGETIFVVGGASSSTAGAADESSRATSVQLGAALRGSAKAVKISADRLVLRVGGKEVLVFDSSGSAKVGAGGIRFDARTVTLKASKVSKIASGSAASAKARSIKPAFVEIELVDQDGEPVAGEAYRVEFPDGGIVEGVLDEEGRAKVLGDAEGQAKVSFPRMDGRAWKKR